jgi:hypothetical protein
MVRRLSALIVTIAIVGAPVAAVVCQVICASHHSDVMAGHAHRHSCPPLAPTTGAVMNGVPHQCGHQSGDDAVGVLQTFQAFVTPVAIVTPVSFQLPVESVGLGTPSRHFEHSPPGLARISQLRI